MLQDRLSKKALAEVLPSELIRWDVHFYPVVGSTQDKAAELFQTLGKGGIFVAADFQETGRGREARKWAAPKGEALLFSLVLLPGHAQSHLHLLTITAALAVCDALRSHLKLKPEVKWPNDVLLSGKKVCGILTEMLTTKKVEKAMIMGIGLNVNQGQAAFPGDLEHVATSLFLETGKRAPRLPLLSAVMKSFEDHYFLFQKRGYEEIIRRWKGYSSMLGRHVALRAGEREVEGTVIDLEDSGAIVLRLDTGKTEAFFGSDCRFV